MEKGRVFCSREITITRSNDLQTTTSGGSVSLEQYAISNLCLQILISATEIGLTQCMKNIETNIVCLILYFHFPCVKSKRLLPQHVSQINSKTRRNNFPLNMIKNFTKLCEFP